MEKGEEGGKGMTQLSVFECAFPPIKTKKKIRLIELFAGIGAQAKALENLGADFEHWKVCEYDKYAVKSYNAIHGTSFKPSDIRNIHGEDLEISDLEKYFYIMTYSFPCQDLSTAGKQRGMKKGEGTRSGLLWEVERILHELSRVGQLPQMLLMENVPAVHGKRNVEDFADWIRSLDDFGYQSYWKDLNASDFGIPQNRDRCFMVSVLGRYSFSFPSWIPLQIGLKDILEQEANEKYYISDEQERRIRESTFKMRRSLIVPVPDMGGMMHTLTSHDSKGATCVELQKEGERRIRRITPKEAWRFMGFADEDLEKASKVNSNSQLYKQAGNSIVVPVLEAIFKQILED